MAGKAFGGFHGGFGQGGVGVDGQGQVGDDDAHFDGQYALGNQFAGAVPRDRNAKNALA
jgi:hypothetical protein